MNSSIHLSALLVLISLALPPGVSAQAHQHGDHGSAYADLMDRDIKALSAEDVEGLLSGAGMQMALPAELNGYPGPRHVLDMGDMLSLTDEQRSSVQDIFDRMQNAAMALGARIVEAERELDAAFAERTIDAGRLTELVTEAARLRGELRAVHLRAHLEVTPVLTDAQRAHYQMARGYGG